MKRAVWGLAIFLAAAGGLSAAPLSFNAASNQQGAGQGGGTVNGTQFTNLGLVGVGRVPIAGATDFLGDTLGSVSSMQITNWASNGSGGYTGTIYILPDRGYNGPAIPGGFSNYAARINAFDFTFTPYTGAGPVAQNQFSTLTYNAAKSSAFVFDTGTGTAVTTTGLDAGPAVSPGSGPGAGQPLPIVNVNGTNKLAIDGEGLVLKADGSGWISDEYGPCIYHFAPSAPGANKVIDQVIVPPAAFQPRTAGSPGPINFTSASDPVNGRVGNQGMEGLGLSPDGKTLFAMNQSGLVQDSTNNKDQRASITRLLAYDVSTPGSTTLKGEYVVELPIWGNTTINKTAAQSEIRVLNDHQILVLSRDTNGMGSGKTNGNVFKSILLVDTSGATNVAGTGADAFNGTITNGTAGTLAPGLVTATVTPVLNLISQAQLSKYGLNQNAAAGTLDSNTLSQKWEAMDLVPVDPSDPTNTHFYLFVGNDNDFLTTNGTMHDALGNPVSYDASTDTGTFPAGTYHDVDTMFMVFEVDIAPVPEPATVMGFALAGLAGVWWFRKRSAAAAAPSACA